MRICYGCGSERSPKRWYGKYYDIWTHNYDQDDNVLCHNCASRYIYRGPLKGRQIGKTHWNWKGGIEFKGQYRLIYSPNHPRAHRGKVYEHILIMEEHIGRPLTEHERIHHIDHNKRNNNIQNLRLIANQADHARLHTKNGRQECKYCRGMRTRKDGRRNNKQIWWCSDCNRSFRNG